MASNFVSLKHELEKSVQKSNLYPELLRVPSSNEYGSANNPGVADTKRSLFFLQNIENMERKGSFSVPVETLENAGCV